MTQATADLWRMRGHQLATVMALEARRSFGGRQALAMYVLAAMPVVTSVFWLRLDPDATAAGIPSIHAMLYEGTFLTFMVYFSCASIFSDLFRRDIAEKSLHYWLLAPVRREVLALGRYCSALVATALVFGLSTVLTYCAYFQPLGWEIASREIGRALPDLGAYLLTTLCGVMSYGALFFLVGLHFESPILPALVIWLWESINHLLPSFLKGLSIIHYLTSMLPIRLDEGVFALSSEPAPAWVAIPGLFLFTAVCLAASVLKVRRLEAAYGGA